jgi:hypothetical protein
MKFKDSAVKLKLCPQLVANTFFRCKQDVTDVLSVVPDGHLNALQLKFSESSVKYVDWTRDALDFLGKLLLPVYKKN